MADTGVAVLESKWWRKWNSSVRSSFEMISEQTKDNAHAYHYEMANSLAALDEAIPRIAGYRNCRYLYVATHGSAQGLDLFNGERVTIPYLKEVFLGLPQGSRLYGIYLASCAGCSESIAAELLEGDTGVVWIAGYKNAVNWLPSSALDMLFFSELITAEKQGEEAKIRHVSERLRGLVPGLVTDLGFRIFMKSRNKIINMLSVEQA